MKRRLTILMTGLLSGIAAGNILTVQGRAAGITENTVEKKLSAAAEAEVGDMERDAPENSGMDNSAVLWHMVKQTDGRWIRISNTSGMKPDDVHRTQENNSLPVRYITDSGLITAVRDQAPYGTCWAHGAISCLETSLIKNQQTDRSVNLSELHLAWYTYYGENTDHDASLYAAGDNWLPFGSGNVYNEGGNSEEAASALARGYGAVSESTITNMMMKQKPGDLYQTKSEHQMGEAFMIDSPNDIHYTGNVASSTHSESGILAVKQALLAYNSVAVMYNHYDGNMQNKDGQYYYYNNPGTATVNHTVTIVGYDDSVEKTNFASGNHSEPPLDGAFLAKNSWGENWGNQGYFWISYCDSTLYDPWCFEAAAETYDQVYQYDGVGFGIGTLTDNEEVEAVNTFTVRNHSTAAAVGVWAAPQSTVEFSVTKKDTKQVLASGAVYFEEGGFRQIRFPAFDMVFGEQYDVSIKNYMMKKGKVVYAYPVELSYHTDSPCKIDFSEEETIIYVGGKAYKPGWDLVGMEDEIYAGNALIKLYANDKEEINPFADVEEDKYYAEPVLWAYRRGITKGVDQSHFGPNQTCKRAEVACFIWRYMGSPDLRGDGIPFEDVGEGAYYHDAVQYCYENGIISGIDSTHFAPNDTITRGQFAAMIYRLMGADTIQGNHPFVDVPEEKYYAKPVLWAYQEGITAGIDEKHFAPDQFCSRGQIATFLYRADKSIDR